jgi:ketosteroid isomerase-like protein
MGNLGAGCEEAKKPWGMVSEDCKGDKDVFHFEKERRGGFTMFQRILTIAVMAIGLTACQGDSNQDAANIAAAKAGYDAFAVGDMEAWAQTQAPDVKWVMPKGFPYGGEYVGAEEVIQQVFTPNGELWPDFKVEPLSFRVSGDVVFIETKMTAGRTNKRLDP